MEKMAAIALRAVVFGVPLGVVFVDCVGYIARVNGRFCNLTG